jgi:hypothetical protein
MGESNVGYLGIWSIFLGVVLPASAGIHLQRGGVGGDANGSGTLRLDRSSSPTLSAILMVVFGALGSRSWWLASRSLSREPRLLGVGVFGDGVWGWRNCCFIAGTTAGTPDDGSAVFKAKAASWHRERKGLLASVISCFR